MKQYLDLLERILDNGTVKVAARENMPSTISLFGAQMRFDLKDSFPILTTKKINFQNIVVELLWFLRGDTNIKYLVDRGCNIWNEDSYNYYVKLASSNDSNLNAVMRENIDGSLSMYTFDEFVKKIKSTQDNSLPKSVDKRYTLGDCGHQYGAVWRKWEGSTKFIDQIKNVITSVKENPSSRRHIVTAIDPSHDTDLALYWCHAMFQFNVRFDKVTYLDCHMYQRSADVFLGVPYNISSYALLTSIIAQMCGMVAGEFIHSFGDVHIYKNHYNQVLTQLTRTPHKLPQLLISGDSGKQIDLCRKGDISINECLVSLEYTDFTLVDYTHDSVIRAKLSTGLK